jgi:hypothetical protein
LAPLDVGSMSEASGFPHAARPRSADPWGMLEACSNIPMGIRSKYRWRARQKDGRQVVPVDVDRDDVAYLEEIGLLEGSSRESIGRALALLLRECQRRGVGR